jgi:hypothetical protein
VRLKLAVNRTATVRLVVRRHGKVRARSKPITLPPSTTAQPIRLRFGHKVPKGKLHIQATAGDEHARAPVRRPG